MLSEETFFKIFLCCLWWQWDPSKYCNSHITMDKVVRIVGPKGLQIASEKEVQALRKNPHFQGVMKVKCHVYITGTKTLHEIQAMQKPLAFAWDAVERINWARVLRNVRIQMTDRGAIIAEGCQASIAHLITKEKYLAEDTRQAAEFASIAEHKRFAITSRYAATVGKETAQ